MSKTEKLIERLQSNPADFTWDELIKVLNHFGYYLQAQGRTGGSRRKFVNKEKSLISIHEPHPQSILKKYQIDLIIDKLNLKK